MYYILQEVEVAGTACTDVVLSTPSYESLTCVLPSGVGLTVDVVVMMRVSDFETLQSLQTPLLGYAAPSVFTLQHPDCSPSIPSPTLVNCPRSGGGRITINGTNFGGSGAVVLIGNTVCADLVHMSMVPQSELQCDLPEGSAGDYPLVLIQSGGAVAAVGNITVVLH